MTTVISPLPTPPTRQDPANFNDRADAFLSALPLFQQEASTLALEVNDSATAVEIARQAVAAVSNVTKWVSGTTYTLGTAVWSPINGVTYRKMTSATGGTTDPSADTVNYKSVTDAAGIVYTAAGTGAALATVQSKLRESVSVLDFYANGVSGARVDPTGVVDSSEGIKAAIAANSSVYFPKGTYKISSTITETNLGSVNLFGDGMGVTVLLKYGDGDLFNISNSGAASGQISISDMTLAPRTDMVTGAAINIRNDSSLPSVRLKNLFIGSSSTYEFKYGVRIKNCTEAIMEGVVCYGLGTSKFIGFDVTSTIAATVPKWFGCSVYNALYGIEITNSVSPGIEGVQFYGCDVVGVNTGVRFRNTLGPTYFPPQIEWIGGHINAGFRNIDIETASQIIVQGALLYNSGNPGDFIRLHQCSDYLIANNEFVAQGGAATGIALSTTADPVNAGLISGNKFSVSGGSNCILLDASKIINNLLIVGNQRVTGSAILSVSGGTKSDSVVLKNNFPLDQNDIFENLVVTTTTPSLAGLRSDFILMSSSVARTVTSLTPRYQGEKVTLYCGGANLTLQHNGTTNGFLLKGSTNFVFGANTSITLIFANGGYWTEIARSV